MTDLIELGLIGAFEIRDFICKGWLQQMPGLNT
jgi:hypothetical protein